MTANTGSLPLQVGGAWLNEVPIDVPSQTTTDLTGDQEPDLKLRVSGIELCQQFDPGQQTMLELEPQLLGSAPQDEALVFTFEIEFQQWNEPCEVNLDGGQEIVPAPVEESG